MLLSGSVLFEFQFLTFTLSRISHDCAAFSSVKSSSINFRAIVVTFCQKSISTILADAVNDLIVDNALCHTPLFCIVPVEIVNERSLL